MSLPTCLKIGFLHLGQPVDDLGRIMPLCPQSRVFHSGRGQHFEGQGKMFTEPGNIGIPILMVAAEVDAQDLDVGFTADEAAHAIGIIFYVYSGGSRTAALGKNQYRLPALQ